MAYEVFYYREFGVDILQFAQISDFLLAAIRNPIVLTFCVLSVGVLASAVALNVVWMQRSTAYAERVARYNARPVSRLIDQAMSLFIVVGYFLIFTKAYARHTARQIQAGTGRRVAMDSATEQTPPGERPILLGAASGYVFLYDPQKKETHILPSDSVDRLVLTR
jgi:hypothetical protein